MSQDFTTPPITVAEALSHPFVTDAGFVTEILIADDDGQGAVIGVHDLLSSKGWILIDKYLSTFGVIREMGFDLQVEPSQQLYLNDDNKQLVVMWMYPMEQVNEYWV